MGWIRKAPTPVIVAVIIVCGLGTLALLGGFVALEYAGRPTDDYRAFVNTLFNAVTFLLVGTGTVASISAARSASNAEDQTNGQLSAKDAEILELRRRLSDGDAG
jgi:hypothetical protein